MKHYLKLVPISAKIHHKQSKMTRICITLAVFLVAVMFGLADMYLQGITQKEMQARGNWHYQFHEIDAKTAALISARPEVKVSGWHNTVSPDAGYSINGQSVAISAQDKNVFEDIFLNSITEGKYPEKEGLLSLRQLPRLPQGVGRSAGGRSGGGGCRPQDLCPLPDGPERPPDLPGSDR